MVKLSKRMQSLQNEIDCSQHYDIMTAIDLQQKFSVVNFDQSVDVAINLGIDARKSDQNVRGFVVLPHGIGRKVRVFAFAQGVNVDYAINAGADDVGMEDLAEKIISGNYQADVVVAMPDTMFLVSKLAPILGPRGLMPNPKTGTISQDIFKIVNNFKVGQICYRNDKNGIIHTTIGKLSFHPKNLKKNLEVLMDMLRKNKPVQVKGTYFKKVVVSTTMGIGIKIDQGSLFLVDK